MQEPRFHEKFAMYVVIVVLAFAGADFGLHWVEHHVLHKPQTTAQTSATSTACTVDGQVEDPCYTPDATRGK